MHSLFSLFKLLAIALGRLPGKWLHPYYVIAGAICALVFLLRVRNFRLQIGCCSSRLRSCCCPPVSYEYTLVHLYAPAALLLIYALHAHLLGITAANLVMSLLFVVARSSLWRDQMLKVR